MGVIICAHCGHALSGEVGEVPYPPTPEVFTGERLGLPLLARGAYAISPVTRSVVLHAEDAPGTVPHTKPGRSGTIRTRTITPAEMISYDNRDGESAATDRCGTHAVARPL
ncbi:hypothetical protein RB200_41295 [Streptomyces sp. PmtG]